MIRITQIKLNIRHDRNDLRKAVLKKLGISQARLLDFVIIKKSIDARDKNNILNVYTVDASTDCDEQILRKKHSNTVSMSKDVDYKYPSRGSAKLNNPPVIIGSGPAGLFAAYFLAKEGYCPVVIERGQPVEERMKTVQTFWDGGKLNPMSNIQFGEGGAGTFSDGKLNTGVNDPNGRNKLVLRTFVENGAPEEIMYINKPHLGTDLLVNIVSEMRKKIIENGGRFLFNSCFERFDAVDGKVRGLYLTDGRYIAAEVLILAIGHSARDTFDYIIHRSGLQVTAKPFAVGVRVEHRQSDIDGSQYGDVPAGLLPPAEYKLTCKTTDGSSVYSFCMCPGGHVVNSSSEEGYTCINGMSYSGRDSDNANSAIVVAVHPSDDPDENIRFQRSLEKKTYDLGGGCIVSQRLADFEEGKVTEGFGSIQPVHKGITCRGDINQILPENICRNIKEAMHVFAEKIDGFDDPDCIVSAVETRTSSPIRINRNDSMEADIHGIYPAGEGAGYAGGITSAAIDGVKVFEKIYSAYGSLS